MNLDIDLGQAKQFMSDVKSFYNTSSKFIVEIDNATNNEFVTMSKLQIILDYINDDQNIEAEKVRINNQQTMIETKRVDLVIAQEQNVKTATEINVVYDKKKQVIDALNEKVQHVYSIISVMKSELSVLR